MTNNGQADKRMSMLGGRVADITRSVNTMIRNKPSAIDETTQVNKK